MDLTFLQVFIADYFFKSNLADNFSYADIQVRVAYFKSLPGNFQSFNCKNYTCFVSIAVKIT